MEGVTDNNGMTEIHGEHLSTDVGSAYYKDCTAANGSVQCIGRQAIVMFTRRESSDCWYRSDHHWSGMTSEFSCCFQP